MHGIRAVHAGISLAVLFLSGCDVFLGEPPERPAFCTDLPEESAAKGTIRSPGYADMPTEDDDARAGVCEAKQLGTLIPDPSAVYCDALGYENRIGTRESGAQYGICVFPDGTECDSWSFYEGQCGEAFFYCNVCGYELIHKDDGQNSYNQGYAVCMDDDGEEIDPYERMGL
jgi:putative hemolysin